MRIAVVILCSVVIASCSAQTDSSTVVPANRLSNGTAGDGLGWTRPYTSRVTGGFQSLYSFGGNTDGETPYASLIHVSGVLYGTTFEGGAGCTLSVGCGTVFKITTSGSESVLYAFGGGRRGGAYPYASVTAMKGTLYGTTFGGGRLCYANGDCGTVFKITPSGKESVLYRFKGGADGAYPYASLIDVNGTLYGTTTGGGGTACNLGCGTVFKITPSGQESVLYRFKGGADGANPYASLVDVNGSLYGTTTDGGTGCSGGCGTVFKVTASGGESVLYAFKGAPDGSYPYASLIDVNGVLYGSTAEGGLTRRKCGPSCGTVFRITASGSESVLYRFDGFDGARPRSSLSDVKGKLYGTTAIGGDETSTACEGLGRLRGCGTIFTTTMSGREKVLHRFEATDGAYPDASLIDVNGVLYGTTTAGGTGCSDGCGTVFRITP